VLNFYTNRELSRRLNINLAKWKRWSREFLPPDPLGGMQSGYARQYNPNEAFTVYLGGHLVADLKFSIPEARQILNDLADWIEQNLSNFNEKKGKMAENGIDSLVKYYTIFIRRKSTLNEQNPSFTYKIRGSLSEETVRFHGFPVRQERYVETSIPGIETGSDSQDRGVVRLFEVTRRHKMFIAGLNGKENDTAKPV
jgi:hypothetical protein